jgi:hypothetical protein
MNPTINDVQQIEPVLTNILTAYFQSESRFIADRVFPGVPVDKDSGTFYTFDKKYWFSDEMKRRAPGQKYPRGEFGVGTDTFKTEQWALAKEIVDEAQANSQLPMSLERAAVRWLGLKALIRKERMWASSFMTTGVWATDDSLSNKWSDTTNGDPVKDIATARRAMSHLTGFRPNVLIMGEIVRDRLIEHPDIAERVKYVQRATADNLEGALGELFRVPRILIGEAIFNSANEGQAEVMAPLFDDDALLLYVTDAPSIEEPSAGYSFHWAPGGGLGTIQPPYRDEEAQADLVRFKMQLVYKKVASDLGYFFPDCVD